ncbi:MAG TPA: ATP-binding protein, partial [Levilinea sp.]|nr:ATP-binding protein [Levilinea sp.]
MTDKPARKNPYVGPRAIQADEKIYGRTTETYNLLDSLIANRIVLLHSPSGAGKSSLVNAGLIPLLKDEGFTVLGPVRVNLEPPPGLPTDITCNRFALSVLLELEEHLPQEEHSKTEDLVCITLQQYLNSYREKHIEATSLVLIFDQFEEILTIAPTAKEE